VRKLLAADDSDAKHINLAIHSLGVTTKQEIWYKKKNKGRLLS